MSIFAAIKENKLPDQVSSAPTTYDDSHHLCTSKEAKATDVEMPQFINFTETQATFVPLCNFAALMKSASRQKGCVIMAAMYLHRVVPGGTGNIPMHCRNALSEALASVSTEDKSAEMKSVDIRMKCMNALLHQRRLLKPVALDDALRLSALFQLESSDTDFHYFIQLLKGD